MSEERELVAATIGHGIYEMFDEVRDRLKRSALEWGIFADRLEELERLHYEVHTLCVRLAEAGVLRGSGDRGPR